MVPFALAGIGLWIDRGALILLFRDELADAGPAASASPARSVGHPGRATMLVHDRNRKRRHASDSFKTESTGGA